MVVLRRARAARPPHGFTLIEMMIVVAIMGILAAVAIPNYLRFQYRTKAGEAKLNLMAIRSAQSSYFGEYGSFVAIAAHPAGTANSNRRAWTNCPATITMSDPGYCILGFFPEGPTYYTYAVATTNANTAISTTPNVEYFADTLSDIDQDGVNNLWGLQVPNQSGVSTLTGAQGCTAVLDGVSVSLTPELNVIGPCVFGMGWTIF